jgi:hypothetical protein
MRLLESCGLVLLFLAACSTRTPAERPAPAAMKSSAVTAAECEQLVDHVAALMAREHIVSDGKATRVQMVAGCQASLSRAQLDCTLAAHSRADLILCRGAGRAPRPGAPSEEECRRATAQLERLVGAPPRGSPEAAIAECRQELGTADVACILAARSRDDLANCERSAPGASLRLPGKRRPETPPDTSKAPTPGAAAAASPAPRPQGP